MKCDNCKKQNGVRCRCKLCKRMICNDCWGKGHNSDYCLRCEGEYNRINPLKVWSIGEESELFAARSEEEVRAFYTELVGQDEATEAFESDFTERDLAEEREFDFDGVKKTMTLAELLRNVHAHTDMPNQVSTSYN